MGALLACPAAVALLAAVGFRPLLVRGEAEGVVAEGEGEEPCFLCMAEDGGDSRDALAGAVALLAPLIPAA